MRLRSLSRHQGTCRGIALTTVAMLLAACTGMHGGHTKQTGIANTCVNRDPAVVVNDFYVAYAQEDMSGLPPANSAMRSQLSSALNAAVEKARGVQRTFIAEHPDEKPTFIEGSLFTSLFEGPTGVEGIKLVTRSDTASEVTVALIHAELGVEPVRWQDGVFLRCEVGDWRIDDVEFRGGWDFASKGRLRAALESGE